MPIAAYYFLSPFAVWVVSAIASHAWHTVKLAMIRKFSFKVNSRGADDGTP